jgi:uncharacterized OB-fold protein
MSSTGHHYTGVACACGALVLTAVDRCPECGAWDPPAGPIDARGVLVGRTTTTGEGGEPLSFGLVDLDCGLRTIGLTSGDPGIGTAVVAVVREPGAPVFVDAGTECRPVAS